jgi:Cof subfamily protein (haloacid dehalogenase superfamily)
VTLAFKLLAIDIDGTLVAESDRVSRENLEALRAAVDAGVHVSICTGRSSGSASRYIQEIGITDNIHVFYDGAIVSRDPVTQPVFIENIAPDLVREMLDYGVQNDIPMELASLNGFFSERETWSTKVKREYFGIDTTIIPFDGIHERERIIRIDIAICDDNCKQRTADFIEYFRNKVAFSHTFSPRYPEAEFVNIVSQGLSKGKALETLCRHLGYNPEDVMAVGDWLNDITMLEYAGLGVAMGNAHDDVKAMADYVTLDVREHGLAAAVLKYLF